MKFAVLVVVTLFSLSTFALSNAVPAVESQFDSTVFYSVTQYDESAKEEGLGFCNGQLISPRVMVTAAHCVAHAFVLKKPTLEIQLGEYLYRDRNGEIVRIGYAYKKKEIIDADFYFITSLKNKLISQGLRTRLGPNDDIAVVVFKRDLEVKPEMQFPQVVTQAELKGLLPRLMQYRPQVVTVNPFEEIRTNDTRRRALLDKVSFNSGGHLESKSIARLAPGDSGGPLFIQIGDQLKLAAVVKGRAETIFSNWDVYGLLDNKICDIFRQISDKSIQPQLCI
ncbi:trypsin-like serine protease [Bdellovibrio sp. HCB2-146]|uniref:trypsin-like serine protease n=1 Tax=Bdellovibrio sp. HCB2-146 TaxID=3394362 RepID=UPI0039BCDD1D